MDQHQKSRTFPTPERPPRPHAPLPQLWNIEPELPRTNSIIDNDDDEQKIGPEIFIWNGEDIVFDQQNNNNDNDNFESKKDNISSDGEVKPPEPLNQESDNNKM